MFALPGGHSIPKSPFTAEVDTQSTQLKQLCGRLDVLKVVIFHLDDIAGQLSVTRALQGAAALLRSLLIRRVPLGTDMLLGIQHAVFPQKL
jgi:hypothetical protein